MPVLCSHMDDNWKKHCHDNKYSFGNEAGRICWLMHPGRRWRPSPQILISMSTGRLPGSLLRFGWERTPSKVLHHYDSFSLVPEFPGINNTTYFTTGCFSPRIFSRINLTVWLAVGGLVVKLGQRHAVVADEPVIAILVHTVDTHLQNSWYRISPSTKLISLSHIR